MIHFEVSFAEEVDLSRDNFRWHGMAMQLSERLRFLFSVHFQLCKNQFSKYIGNKMPHFVP